MYYMRDEYYYICFMTIIFVLIIIVAGYHIVTNWRKKVKVKSNYETVVPIYTSAKYPNSSVETYYESHCWSCKSEIDSRGNSRCYKCKRFCCKTCGACLCGKGYSSKSTYQSSKWVTQGYLSNNNKGYYTSNYSSKKSGYKSSKSPYGHCKRCSKKLSGDKSKSLCYACWKKDS